MNINNPKPYKVKNKLSRKLEIPANPQVGPVGYISIVVYTASGALPVPDAVITVYNINEDGEENVLYHLITDRSGNSPLITLPVIQGEREYEFTTYNIRVQAVSYYTTNVLDVRVFPDVTTTYRINLIPTAQGSNEENGQTVVIPPIPLDITN